jgi:predicted Zn-dependent peptidase
VRKQTSAAIRRTLRTRLRPQRQDDAKYEAVTLEDVKRIAAKILAEDKFVISVVQPGK